MEEIRVVDSELQCPDWLDYEVLFYHFGKATWEETGAVASCAAMS